MVNSLLAHKALPVVMFNEKALIQDFTISISNAFLEAWRIQVYALMGSVLNTTNEYTQ